MFSFFLKRKIKRKRKKKRKNKKTKEQIKIIKKESSDLLCKKQFLRHCKNPATTFVLLYLSYRVDISYMLYSWMFHAVAFI